MTLEELLQTPLMRGAEIVAGEAGLSRKVERCYLASAIEERGLYKPNSLLLVSASNGDKHIEKLLDRVPIENLAGVAFVSSFQDDQPASIETIEEFERRGIPLILLPLTTNTLTFIRRFIATYLSHASDDFRSEEWLQEVCFGDAPKDDDLAKSFGYNPSYQYYCAILTARNAENVHLTVREMESDSVRSFIHAALSQPDAPVLSYSSEQQVVAFFPWNGSIQDMHDKVLRTISDMRRAATSLKWTTVVGSSVESIEEFHPSYLNALRTLEVIELLDVRGKASFYDDWYMQMLLLKEPRAELREHMEHTLAPILNSPELLETLTNYLIYGENLKLTSEKMFIHVNTLKYRLKRIQELLDVELSDPNTRFRLRMAITIERYLRD